MAAAIFAGVAKSDEEIFPRSDVRIDSDSWRDGLAKSLERAFAAFGAADPVGT